MKILFTGGGTAGHINPALAVAGYIKNKHPNAEIRFVGTQRGMESKLVPAAGYHLYTVEMHGLDRKKLFKNLKNVHTLLKSVTECKRIIREFQPDVVIGTGGYVSFSSIYAAAKLGVPAAVHEQNAYPGVTTRICSRYADAILLTMEESLRYFEKRRDRCHVTGLPLREEIVFAKKEEARRALHLDDRPDILSVGGSLGARLLNEAVAELILWHSGEKKYQHIHATGQYGWEWMEKHLAENGVTSRTDPQIRIYEYIEMPAQLAACDLIISRCGANTLCEIQAQGKPSVLIPSPNVTENHQYYNGMALVKNHAAVLIEEKDLTGEKLIEEVSKILSSPEQMREMARNAHKMAILDANERIYKIILKLMEKRD